jgi:hypothetical protein
MTIAQQLKIKEFPFIIKDNRGNQIYYENSSGYWVKNEYDDKGNEIYFEDSYGTIIESKPEINELTLEEIANKFKIDINSLRIKTKK